MTTTQEQRATITAADVDADGNVHVRFTAASESQALPHFSDCRPHAFVEIVRGDGKTLFSTFLCRGQRGRPWEIHASAGGGAAVAYTSTPEFYMALDASLLQMGDSITLKVSALGGEVGGHGGALGVIDMRRQNAVTTSLWVTAQGQGVMQRHAGSDGAVEVTYVYTYSSEGHAPIVGDSTCLRPADTPRASGREGAHGKGPWFGIVGHQQVML